MRSIATALAVVALLSGISMTLLAQSGSAGTAAGAASLDAQVEELLAMSPEKRRAHLKALSPAERRGLWMRVKRAEFGSGEAPNYSKPPTYEELNGFPVDAGGWKSPKRVTTKAAVGTITYDSGLPNTAFSPGSPSLLGNRFNTHTGIPVCNPGTVSTVQALVVPGPANTTSSAGFVLLGPQTSMGGAIAIDSTFGPATGLIDSVTFAGLGATYTGSEFFVLFGAFSSVYVPVFGPGTTLGQGHHAIIGNTGGMGPSITATTPFATALNGFIRATGVIVPVELMTFEVD